MMLPARVIFSKRLFPEYLKFQTPADVLVTSIDAVVFEFQSKSEVMIVSETVPPLTLLNVRRSSEPV